MYSEVTGAEKPGIPVPAFFQFLGVEPMPCGGVPQWEKARSLQKRKKIADLSWWGCLNISEKLMNESQRRPTIIWPCSLKDLLALERNWSPERSFWKEREGANLGKPSTVAPYRKNCSRVHCLVTWRVLSRVQPGTNLVQSNWQLTALFSWTK